MQIYCEVNSLGTEGSLSIGHWLDTSDQCKQLPESAAKVKVHEVARPPAAGQFYEWVE